MTDIRRLKKLSGISNEDTLNEVSPEGYFDKATDEAGVLNRQIDEVEKVLKQMSGFKKPYMKYAQPGIDGVTDVLLQLRARRDKRRPGIHMARQKMKDRGWDMSGYTAREHPPGSPGWKKDS